MLDLSAFAHAEQATGGSDTTVWHLARGDRQYALRVFRADQIQTLRRELVAVAAARAGGVPVPGVLAFGTHQQRPAMLTEWCSGHPLLQQLGHAPGSVLALGRQFGRWQAAIHRVLGPRSLRSNWIDWAGPLPSDLPRLLGRLTQTGRPRLLHLDYHPLNVLVERGRVSAVLDWTNAHAGDPRADVARTLSILRVHPPTAGSPPRAARLLFEIGWRIGYGPTGSDLAPFHVWAGLAMQHDLAPRFSRAELADVRRWTDAWTRRISL